MSTTYVVLEAMDEKNGTWLEIGRQKANGDKQAIRGCLAHKAATEGEQFKIATSYQAVPLRNWRGFPVEVEAVQKVVFGSTLAEAEEEK